MADVAQTYRLSLPQSVEKVWDWHARPGAFMRLAPPWESMELIEGDQGLQTGARTVFKIRKAGVPITWVAEHTDYDEHRLFVDEQREGPFARWRHEHRFVATADGGCLLEDHIEWSPPGGPLGGLAVPTLKGTNDRMFRFRHRRLRDDLARHARFHDRERLTVAISGVTGLVGGALKHFLTAGGHRVVGIVRRDPGPGDCLWDPAEGTIDTAALEGVDAIVHLAGAPVSQKWTDQAKRAIRDSRVHGTRLIVQAIAQLASPPSVLISASAIGYYGDRSGEICTEKTKPGTGFLAEVGQEWEAAAHPATDLGVRLATPRIGIVTTAAGGALQAMLPAFRAAGGGPIGSGEQWVSWISLDDLVGMLHRALFDEAWQGPFNAVAPNPVQQKDQARTLGRALSRPAVVPVPGAAITALFGEMGEHLILGGQRVQPSAAFNWGFSWTQPDYGQAVRQTLGVD